MSNTMIPSSNDLYNVSIIIPVADTDKHAHTELAKTLYQLCPAAEHLFCYGGNRAQCMNRGAVQAKRDWLWFLHVDSQPTQKNINTLATRINNDPCGVLYFDLAFDVPYLKINAWGANLRARWLHLPFGDQGLFLKKQLFLALGGYPDQKAEDLYFIKKAKQQETKIINMKSTLTTSARKYQQKGYFKTVIGHFFVIAKFCTGQLKRM